MFETEALFPVFGSGATYCVVAGTPRMLALPPPTSTQIGIGTQHTGHSFTKSQGAALPVIMSITGPRETHDFRE